MLPIHSNDEKSKPVAPNRSLMFFTATIISLVLFIGFSFATKFWDGIDKFAILGSVISFELVDMIIILLILILSQRDWKYFNIYRICIILFSFVPIGYGISIAAACEYFKYSTWSIVLTIVTGFFATCFQIIFAITLPN